MRLRNRRTQAAQSLASRTGPVPRVRRRVGDRSRRRSAPGDRRDRRIGGSRHLPVRTAGRGKTVLATLFFDAIPELHKVRIHFHNFLADIQTLIA